MNTSTHNRFVNLTRYTIEVWVPGEICADEFEPSGAVAEFKAISTTKESIWGIPMRNCDTGPVLNLPEPTDGVVYIVSPSVAKVAKRADVVAPFGVSPNPNAFGKVVVAEGFESFCESRV